MEEYNPEPRTDGVYDTMDEGVEPWFTPTEIRMPDISDYNPLDRLWQNEKEDERHRGDNELQHELMNHAQDCKQTHYYWTRNGDKKLCCTGCMLDINKLYGMHRYYEEKRKVA